MNIVVDCDGVLINNVRFEDKVLDFLFRRIMEKYGVSKERAKEMFWKIGKKLEGRKEWHDWRIYSEELKLGDAWKEAHLANLKYLKLVKGAKDFLSKVKGDGHRLILASDAIKPVVEWKLNRFGLEKYFDLILSQDDTGCIKSEEKYFKQILNKLKEPAKNFVVIDNRLDRGIETAKKVGMKTIYIKRKEHSHLYLKDKKEVEPDFSVKTLGQAYEKIKEIEARG